ncbi:MAG: protein kinase [Myxococcales bacterium]|nr:protein kinase [Myxococcales bacterium]
MDSGAGGGERGGDALPLALAPTVAAQPESGVGDTLVMPEAEPGKALPLATVDPSHYQQHEELARGGMGVVRRASDRRIGREVALKELLADQPGLRRRFEREARVTAQLQHPGIVPVYEMGCWPDGRPFYTMKLVNGRPLDAVIDEALDEGARLALIPRLLPAVEAIAYAHDRGVIHRDLKPANVLLGEFGETVVIDWGLARAIGEEDDSSEIPPSTPVDSSPSSSVAAARSGGKLTMEGAVMGTPAYMPPEQACGDPLDARADVYSLGALIYHTVIGRAPYDGKTAHEVLAAVLMGPPPPASRLAPGLPRDLATIIDKAMAQDPLDRYPDAGALARDLRAFSNGRLVGAYSYSSSELLLRFVRRNRALSLSLLGLAVLAVVGSMMVLRAYRISEGQRLRAEEAEGRARREERAAHERLSQMHANDAIQRLRDRDHLGAQLFAAAALLEQPANEVGPHHALLEAPPVERQALLAGPGATWAAARALRFAVRGRELPSHEDWVYDVLPSSDERWVVTAGADRRVHIWDAKKDQLHARLEGHEGTVYQVAMSRDERQLATSSYDGTVRLWSFPDGKLERELQHPSDRVYGLCYASDGRVVAAGAGGVIAFYDPPSGELVDRMEAEIEIPMRLTCGRKRPLALLGSRGSEVLVIDTASHEITRRLDHESASIRSSVLSPDERDVITADKNGRLRRFDVQTGDLLDEIPTDQSCDSLAISSDGRWLALGGEVITIVDRASFRPVARLRDHRSRVFALAFDPTGRRLFSGGFDRRVVEWLVADLAPARRFVRPSDTRLDAVQIDEDVVVAAGDEGAITWWDRRTGALGDHRDVHAGPIRALLMLGDARLVSTGLDRTLKVVDGRTHEVVRAIDLPHFGDGMSLHPDGRTLALGRGDGTVVVYDTTTWSPRLTKKAHEGRAWWVGYDPSGERLGTASFSGAVAILEPTTGEVLRQWRGHDARIYGASWRPDGRELVTVDYEGWVRAWDPETGQQRRAFRVLGGERLSAIMHSRDAGQLLITSNGGLRLYTPEGNLVARLDLGDSVAPGWTADGLVVGAVGSDVLILSLEASQWQIDPRRLLSEAEAAAATSLSDMMGMAPVAP